MSAVPPVPRRVVFLDFDGVLNSMSWRREHRTGDVELMSFEELHAQLRAWLDPACVARVQRICDATGAVIVLSTSWRVCGLDVVRPILRDAGLTAPVIGKIGREDRGRGRDAAIREWVGYHVDVVRWLALDDQPLNLGAHAIRTSDATGITDDDVVNAIRALSVHHMTGRGR